MPGGGSCLARNSKIASTDLFSRVNPCLVLDPTANSAIARHMEQAGHECGDRRLFGRGRFPRLHATAASCSATRSTRSAKLSASSVTCRRLLLFAAILVVVELILAGPPRRLPRCRTSWVAAAAGGVAVAAGGAAAAAAVAAAAGWKSSVAVWKGSRARPKWPRAAGVLARCPFSLLSLKLLPRAGRLSGRTVGGGAA